jgi:hypothetical protein
MERIRVNMHRHRLSDLKGEHLNVGVVVRMFSSDASVEFYSSQCRSENTCNAVLLRSFSF